MVERDFYTGVVKGANLPAEPDPPAPFTPEQEQRIRQLIAEHFASVSASHATPLATAIPDILP